MTITTEGANRLYQQVADAIAKLIRGGQFAMGSRLPPERDLVTRFGVSRPTVREALVALEIASARAPMCARKSPRRAIRRWRPVRAHSR
jgi:DNA-binding FadR family transcriptional regulator